MTFRGGAAQDPSTVGEAIVREMGKRMIDAMMSKDAEMLDAVRDAARDAGPDVFGDVLAAVTVDVLHQLWEMRGDGLELAIHGREEEAAEAAALVRAGLDGVQWLAERQRDALRRHAARLTARDAAERGGA